MPEIPLKRIEVFPNTGAQTYRIPLAELVPSKSESFFLEFAKRFRGNWEPWGEDFPWIRYRYDIDSEEPVIFLTVESNLGEDYRGLLVDVEDKLYSEAPDEDEEIPFYAAYDEVSIEDSFGSTREIPLSELPIPESAKANISLPINLLIFWEKAQGQLPIDVDLVVDLGNSRTVALLLEAPDPGMDMPFERRVRVLRFTPRGMPYKYGMDGVDGQLEDPYAIINSWMILHDTMFRELEPEPPFTQTDTSDPQKKISIHWAPTTRNGKQGFQKRVYIPHGFADLSPALIGGGRHQDGAEQVLARVNLERNATFFLSSPKRYAWDDTQLTDRFGTFWKQIPNGFSNDKDRSGFRELSGLIRCFMHPEGKQFDWNIDERDDADKFRGVPMMGTSPTYPRRDAICWFALSVIEAAHRQINSPGYIESSFREPRPRRLKKIRVSYPAGWTDEERSRYLEQWQRAVDLFSLVRFQDLAPIAEHTGELGGDRPVLSDPPLDEAVCSQLPIIFSDISTLANSGEAWLNLFGNGEAVTVMNIDIGGGTTDVAINRYRAESQQSSIGHSLKFELIPDLRFRHGSSIAGDMLVKKVIEKLVVPGWLRASNKQSLEKVPDAERLIGFLFRTPADGNLTGIDSKAEAKLVRFLRLCLIPVANALLSRLVQSSENEGWGPVSIEKVIEPDFAKDFNEMIERLVQRKSANGRYWRGEAFAVEGIKLTIDRDALVKCIDETFSNLLSTLAGLCGRHRCDLVIVSGKPSELPRIRELMLRKFPVLPQRVLHVKSFPAGSWYPFKHMGSDRITDAKTCTVVGAALFQDICNGNLGNFTIRTSETDELSRKFCWGFVQKQMLPRDFFAKENILFRPSDISRPREGETIISKEKTFKDFPLNIRIGRQLETMRDLLADPVYEISLDRLRYPANKHYTADITLRWVSEVGKGESLEMVDIKPSKNFPELDISCVCFKLNTLLDESFWLDNPSLEVALQ